MAITLNPYLGFRDNAREAITFYQSVFGGDLTVSTFGDFGMSDEPGEKDKVMHSQLRSPAGLVLMAADTPASMEYTSGGSVSVALSWSDDEELRGYFDKLADGGTVTEPFERAPWGDLFGMCTDRFGVSWLVNGGAAA